MRGFRRNRADRLAPIQKVIHHDENQEARQNQYDRHIISTLSVLFKCISKATARLFLPLYLP
jgi:hypothetical protein